MSEAELHFERTLNARGDISTRKPRAMIIRERGRETPLTKEYLKPEELLDDLELEI